MSELFERLESLVERESEADRTGRQFRYDLPVAARVAAGTALDGVHYHGREPGPGPEVHLFSCERNQSRLRAGSRLRLSRGDPRAPVARVELLDDRFDGRRYVLRVAVQARETEEPFEGSEPWVLDEDHVDLLDVELGILKAAREAGLGAWLDGGEPSRLAPAAAPSPYEAGLSGSLLEAFRRASAAENWSAIQGPPGTGKTFLLARLALEAARRGERVLVTAVSHQAIHNALAQCYWLAAEREAEEPSARALIHGGFYKLGSSRANGAGLPVGVRPARGLPRRKGALVAGGTIYGVFAAADADALPAFDLALFDESGQAPLVLALGARLAARRAVFIGDDHQLPPVRQAAAGSGGLAEASALHLVRKRYEAPYLLAETRRLNADLCRAVSDCFYEGRLSPGPAAEGRRLPLRKPPRPPFAAALDPAAPLVFLDVPHEGCRAVSEIEARWTAALVCEALRCGVPGREIGVISPFRAQCNRIRFLLQGGPAEADEVLVSTVERFQGQERELVLLSLASSHPGYVSQLGAFLFSPNRLNVAVSRARTKVLLLGALRALRSCAEAADPDAEAGPGCRAFLRLAAAAHPVAAEGEPPGVGPAAAGAPGPRAEASPESFDIGHVVEHPEHGVGIVVGTAAVAVGEGRESALKIRFREGGVRTVVPSLCRPGLRLVTRGEGAP